MTNEELIANLEKRIGNCEKRIEEVEKNPNYAMLGGALTTQGIYWARYWGGQLKAYKVLLKDVKGDK